LNKNWPEFPVVASGYPSMVTWDEEVILPLELAANINLMVLDRKVTKVIF
jgi:hypothetical protein